jgi:hypothetical protein
VSERRIKPEELDIGMQFRLTGDAETAQERDMANHVFKVTNVDTAYRPGAHLIIENVKTGEETETVILPWVPVILIEVP